MKTKRHCLKFFFSFMLALFLSVPCFVSDARASSSRFNDPGFMVGVVGHPGFTKEGWSDPTFWSGYGASDADIERQIHLLAEMGAKIYRLAAHDSERVSTIDVVEKVVALCEKYGIDVMLVLTHESGDASIVERLKGRVKYYQVSNEMNVQAHRSSHGINQEDFWMSTDPDAPSNCEHCLDVQIGEAIKTIKAIRALDPEAKITINGSWTHYGFLDYAFARFKEDGVDIDLIGWDWYSNMECNRDGAHYSVADGLNSVAKFMHERYHKDVFINEYNMWPEMFDRTTHITEPLCSAMHNDHTGNGNKRLDPSEAENMETLAGSYLVKNIQYLYENRANNHIKGLMVYELLDEPEKINMKDPDPNSDELFEGDFGITYTKTLDPDQRRYQILGPKPQYYDLQKFLGGGFVPIKRLNPPAALPEYTITAFAADVNTDGTVISTQTGGRVTGSGVYKENAVVTLIAAANSGSEFLGWYRGGIRISKNPVYQFTAVEDANNGDKDGTDGKFAYEARFTERFLIDGQCPVWEWLPGGAEGGISYEPCGPVQISATAKGRDWFGARLMTPSGLDGLLQIRIWIHGSAVPQSGGFDAELMIDTGNVWRVPMVDQGDGSWVGVVDNKTWARGDQPFDLSRIRSVFFCWGDAIPGDYAMTVSRIEFGWLPGMRPNPASGLAFVKSAGA